MEVRQYSLTTCRACVRSPVASVNIKCAAHSCVLLWYEDHCVVCFAEHGQPFNYGQPFHSQPFHHSSVRVGCPQSVQHRSQQEQCFGQTISSVTFTFGLYCLSCLRIHT